MLAADDNFSVPVEPHRSGVNELTASDIRWILRRGWLFPVMGTVIGLLLALFVISMMPQLYTSSVRVLVDRTMSRFLQTNKIVDEPSLDDVDMAGQFYVLSSDSIVVPVIRSLNLTRDPEFVGRSAAGGGGSDVHPCASYLSGSCFFYGVAQAKGYVKQLIGLKNAVAIDPERIVGKDCG